MAAEGNIVGEVGLLVVPVGPEFNQRVKQIIDKAEKDASFRVSADTRDAQQSVQALNQDVGRLNSSFIDAAVNVAGVTAAFYGLKGIVEKTVGAFSKTFDQLAQARAGFTSILHSEAAGGRLLTDIREFARVSPFVTQELVNYSQQLLGVGLSAEKIIPLLKDTGNIIASVGGDTQNLSRVLFTLTQIQSIGRLAGQDAMQLQSSLIPITKYLASFLGKTTAEVKKLQEQGKISAETVFQAISAQGAKVAGAMDKATRNIAGARAILSDTITIMIQDQPALQRIFEDLFKAILAFSNFLSTPEFQEAATAFFEAVGKIYDSLKPLGASLASIGGSGTLAALNSFASILTVIAQALDALPVAVIESFARVLAALAVIRGPLMLLRYANSFKDLTVGALGAGSALRKVTSDINTQAIAAERATVATEALAVAETNVAKASLLARAKGKIGANAGFIATLGLGIAGSAVTDNKNGARDLVGGTLTGAAVGAAIGSAVPVVGTAAGAGVGATIGLISGIVTHSRKAAEEVKKHADEARTAWAEGVNKTISDTFGGVIDSTSISAFFEEVTKLQERAANDTRWIDSLSRGFEILKETAQSAGADAGVADAIGDNIELSKKFQDELKRTNAQIDKLIHTGPFVEALQKASDNLAVLQGANETLFEGPTKNKGATAEATKFFNVLTGQKIPETAAEYKYLEIRLKEMGLTIVDVTTKTVPEIQALIDAFKAVPNAIKDAAKAADEFNKRYSDSKAATDAFTTSIVTKIETQQKLQTAVQAALNAAAAAAEAPGNRNAQLEADKQAYLLRAEVINQARAAQIKQTTALQLGEIALQEAITARANAQKQAAGLAIATGDAQIAKLLELAGVADTLENRDIAIDIVTKGFEAAMAKLALLAQEIIKLRQLAAGQTSTFVRGGLATGGGPNLSAEAADLAAQKYAASQQLAKGIIPGTDGKKLADQIGAAVAAEAKAGGGGGGGGASGPSFADNLKTATEALTSALDSAAQQIEDAAKTWTASIKKRTEFEDSVSTRRLIGNTTQQTAQLAELASSLADLRARGVSQGVLDALGIDNVGDLRQVRSLNRSSDADLAALTDAVGNLRTTSIGLATTEEDRRTRDNITAAILTAAETLGIDPNATTASNIVNNLHITPGMDSETIALQILQLLTSGRVL